jgi:hypothetical protein
MELEIIWDSISSLKLTYHNYKQSNMMLKVVLPCINVIRECGLFYNFECLSNNQLKWHFISKNSVRYNRTIVLEHYRYGPVHNKSRRVYSTLDISSKESCPSMFTSYLKKSNDGACISPSRRYASFSSIIPSLLSSIVSETDG